MKKNRLLATLVSLIMLIACGDEKTNTIVEVRYGPVLYDLTAPDSLLKGSPVISYIFVNAFDLDGLDDIDSVYFVSTRPDGSSNGNRLYMFDDGQTYDDSVALDGRYTIGIQSPDTSSQSGDYIFRFYAFDRQRNPSNTLEKIVTAY